MLEVFGQILLGIIQIADQMTHSAIGIAVLAGLTIKIIAWAVTS